MKKINPKKIAILVLIAIAIIALIFLLVKTLTNKGEKATKEETTIAEKMSIDYITKLTYGAGTSYKGIDLLFEKEKVTYKDLSVGNILTAAFDYATINLNTTVPSTVIAEIDKTYKTDDFTIMPGEVVRTAIKEIFGVEFENQDYTTGLNFSYTYKYLPEYDVYLRGYQELNIDTENYLIDYKTIDTISKDNKLQTKIAVAYIYYDGSKYYYTKDNANNEIIYESKKPEFKEDKIDKFDHYTITLKKIDNKYVFESIEKNK